MYTQDNLIYDSKFIIVAKNKSEYVTKKLLWTENQACNQIGQTQVHFVILTQKTTKKVM